jgi:type VI secretion system secreted protein Hcp
MASDIFAKLGDIKGESADDKHKDEIEVFSFSWGITHPGSSGAGAGQPSDRVAFKDLSIVHRIDKASPALMRACATGKHLDEAIITQRKAGKTQHEYLIIKMNDVTITGVVPESTSGEAGSEVVSLTFGKVHLEYRPQRPDGSLDAPIHFKYDLKGNKEA